LTNKLPKAAIPIMGMPSLHYTLHRLEKLGFRDVAINSHFEHTVVEGLIKEYRGSCHIRSSYEPTILGSGGALNPLRSWLSGHDALLVNPDIISDFDLVEFAAAHKRTDAIATLAITTSSKGSVWYRDNLVQIITKDQVQSSQLQCGHGIGVFALSDRLLSYQKESGFINLTDTINAAISAGERVAVVHHNGYFSDLGDSIDDYLRVHRDLIKAKARLFDTLGFAEFIRIYARELKIHFDSKGEALGCVDVDAVLPNTRIDPTSRNYFIFSPTKVHEHCKFWNCIIQSKSAQGSMSVRDVVWVSEERVELPHPTQHGI
jgi:NDP-sugar pyrophosphorylase family protein